MADALLPKYTRANKTIRFTATLLLNSTVSRYQIEGSNSKANQ